MKNSTNHNQIYEKVCNEQKDNSHIEQQYIFYQIEINKINRKTHNRTHQHYSQRIDQSGWDSLLSMYKRKFHKLLECPTYTSTIQKHIKEQKLYRNIKNTKL